MRAKKKRLRAYKHSHWTAYSDLPKKLKETTSSDGLHLYWKLDHLLVAMQAVGYEIFGVLPTNDGYEVLYYEET